MSDRPTTAAPRRWVVRSGADIGRAIADMRAARNLTQEDLAGKTGITRAYIAKLETGRSVSLLEHLLRILRRLGATVTISMDDDGQA